LASLEQSQRRLRAAMLAGASEERAGRFGGEWLGGEVSLEFILLFSFSGDGGKMLCWRSLSLQLLENCHTLKIENLNLKHLLMQA
jgi:hypothetical protein